MDGRSSWRAVLRVVGFCVAVAVFAVLAQLTTEQPIHPIDPANVAYDFVHAKSPRVTGLALKLTSVFVELPFVGPLFLTIMRRANGFASVRSYG